MGVCLLVCCWQTLLWSGKQYHCCNCVLQPRSLHAFANNKPASLCDSPGVQKQEFLCRSAKPKFGSQFCRPACQTVPYEEHGKGLHAMSCSIFATLLHSGLQEGHFLLPTTYAEKRAIEQDKGALMLVDSILTVLVQLCERCISISYNRCTLLALGIRC